MDREARRALEQNIRAAGALIHDSLEGQAAHRWDLEDALGMRLERGGSAGTAALLLLYALARMPGEEEVPGKTSLLREWRKHAPPCRRDAFLPVAPLAIRVLRAIPADAADRVVRLLDNVVGHVEEEPARVGDLLQRLAQNRKDLGVYHSLPASATLMAHLAIPTDGRWADPDLASSFRIADYACGTGELLTAACSRVRELHQEHGGNPDDLHRDILARSITGLDVLPASVAIAATELHLMGPETGSRGTSRVQAVALRQGPINFGRHGRQNPSSLEGRPVGLGSLDLLDGSSIRQQDLRPFGRTAGEQAPLRFRPGTQDLVIMSPPYNKPVNTREMDQNRPSNRMDILPTSTNENRQMETRMNRVRKAAKANPRNGLALMFSHIADRMVRPGGTIALMLPMSVVNTHTGRKERNEGWKVFRWKLAREYRDVMVVGITGFTETESNFSHDTTIAEVIIIARKLAPGESTDGAGCFINLERRPEYPLEAARLAQAIQETAGLLRDAPDDTDADIILNGSKAGIATRSGLREDGIWPMARVQDPGLVREAMELAQGRVPAGEEGKGEKFPVRPLEEIAGLGSPTPDIDGHLAPAGGLPGTHQVLRSHDSTEQKALEVARTESMRAAGEKSLVLRRMEAVMSRLHLNDNLRYNSQPLAACMTPQPSVGGKGWPNAAVQEPREEKALAVWLNTSLSLIIHWSRSNRTQTGLGYLSRRQLSCLPVLDVTRLNEAQLESMAGIFEQVRELPMLPASEAWRDRIRMAIDRRVLEDVLGLGPETTALLKELRNRWCLEPTVQGKKGQSASRQPNMERLRDMVEEERPAPQAEEKKPAPVRETPVERELEPVAAFVTPPASAATPEEEALPPTPAPVHSGKTTPTAPSGRRTKLLEEISKTLNLQIHAITRTTRQEAVDYDLRTEHGPLRVGPVSNILRQQAFRDIVANGIQRVVPEQRSRSAWDQVAEKILQASVEMQFIGKPAELGGTPAAPGP